MTDSHNSFEYALWRLLAGHNISRPVQTQIGNQVLELARQHLGLNPQETAAENPGGKYTKGTAIHYFRSTTDADAACNRIARVRLRSSRITYIPEDATCTHCRASAGLVPVPGANQVGKSRSQLAEAEEKVLEVSGAIRRGSIEHFVR